jgi:hypothetical protein
MCDSHTGRERSALHPVHERYDGQAERRRDDARWVSRRCLGDVADHDGHRRARRLLVHERYRLDRRTYANRVRRARKRPDVDLARGLARLSDAGNGVRDRRAAARDEALHRTDARAHVDALRRRPRQASRSHVARSDLLRGRAAQPRSVALHARRDVRGSRGDLQSVVADGTPEPVARLPPARNDSSRQERPAVRSASLFRAR